MSKEEEIQAFRDILRTKPSWSVLAGTEMEEIITTYVGQRGEASKLEAERDAQETFVSLAFNRDSIMARAEDEGYIPTLPQPFENEIVIENKGASNVNLKLRQPFISSDGIRLVIEDIITINPAEIKTIRAKQLEKQVITQTVIGNVFEEFILGGLDADGNFTIHEFSITFDGDPWENIQNFRNAVDTSEIYHTLYKMTDELAIRTGNGNTGRMPQVGSIMEATIWHTKGDKAFLVPGLQLVTVGEILDEAGLTARLKITTGTVINSGQPFEPIESTRKHVLSKIQTGPVVARNPDYEFMIIKAFPDLVYLKVWGEKEMVLQYGYNLDYINKAYYSFLIENESLTAERAIDIAAYYDEMIRPMNITPENVTLNKATFQIDIQGRIDRQFIIADVESKLTALLMGVFGIYKNVSGRVKNSDVYKEIIESEYFRDTQPHLNRKHKPYFYITLSGVTQTGFFDEYIYLDNVTFGDDDGGSTLGYVEFSR